MELGVQSFEVTLWLYTMIFWGLANNRLVSLVFAFGEKESMGSGRAALGNR